ncbi:MAG: ABC transporter permease [Chloroflexi bacterium]|nr:ABC transporter permease [Chloroflexota bacterium]MCC6893031.1 ABC transporter permease [Anaerolineae bacterium]
MSNIQSLSLDAEQIPVRTERVRFWRVFSKHRLAVASLLLLIVFSFVGVFADQITPYDPNSTNTSYAKGKPQPPSAEYALGTDNYGRDYFSRTISAVRISLFVGITAVAFQLVIGVSVGAAAGYFGGRLDNILMRITDIFLSIPAFMLLLIMAGILGGSLAALIIAIGGLNWMTVARLVRAEFLSLREREFVLAGRALGASPWRLIIIYLLPNTISSIVISATLSIPSAILTESALSFLGLGVPPPNASLGNMLQEAQQWIRASWWMWVVPGVTISLIVLAFNFVGDGLRDALDRQLG